MSERIKLVRSRAAEKDCYDTRPPRDEFELRHLIALKLHEEVGEVIDAPDDPAEYADVIEALLAYAEVNGVYEADIWEMRNSKLLNRGGLLNGVVMVGRRNDKED